MKKIELMDLNIIYSNALSLKRRTKLIASVSFIFVYILSLHMLFDYIQHFALMMLFIPAVISASLFGLRLGMFTLFLCTLYSLGFAYAKEVDYALFVTKFSPGLLLTVIVVLFVARIHQLSLKLNQELESKQATEELLKKKDNDNQIYLERLEAEIEEKFNAEQTLKKSEEQYRTLIEKSRIGVLIDDLSGYFTYFNKEFVNMSGYTEDELNSLNFNDLVHPDDKQLVLDTHNKRVAGEPIPSRYEFRFIRKNGEVLFVEVDATPLKKYGNIIGTRAFIWDISARKKAEIALAESENRFRSIYNNATMGFYRMKPDRTIIMANPKFLILIGVESLDTVVGKRLDELLEISEERENFHLLLEMNSKLEGYESEWYRANGVLFFGRETAWTIFDDNGKPKFIDAILEDVTMKKQIDEEREQLILLLQSAKSEIKVLSGLLPICSSCKRIRDDHGSWSQVEQYIDEHSEAEFSHGICPDCAAKLYPSYV